MAELAVSARLFITFFYRELFGRTKTKCVFDVCATGCPRLPLLQCVWRHFGTGSSVLPMGAIHHSPRLNLQRTQEKHKANPTQ